MRFSFTALQFGLTLLLLVLAPGHALLQGTESCPAVIEQAFSNLDSVCADMGRNSACYGYDSVSALFTEAVAEDFFTQPSDRADLITLQNIETSALDPERPEWGVAVLSTQANIPDTLPGQAVRFILLGDVAMTNDVPPDEAVALAAEPVSVTTLVRSNIRSAPTTRANVVTSVNAGTTLSADALSEDGEWLRVTSTEISSGWLNRQLIDASADLSGLPSIAEEPRSPMQAFHVRTSLRGTTCEEAPSLIVVQGPDNLAVQVTANGADIVIGSTIILQTTDENTLRLATISGRAQVGNFNVPAGFTMEAELDENNDVSGPFGGFRPLTQSELNELQILELLPEDLLNYPIDVPNRPVQVQTQPQGSTATATPGGSVTPAPSGGGATCAGFRATSPLDGLAFGLNTFYWDPAPGATSYRLVINGAGSLETGGTNAQFDLYFVGVNMQMSWYVEALVNGQVACTTDVVTIPREAAPPPFSASWVCSGDNTSIIVQYQNVPVGTTSVTAYINSLESEQTVGVPPFSGSIVFSGNYGSGGYVVANPSGQRIDLPGILQCGSND
ncbi:MAG: SH3 domain-containing protein [Anaerolineae bacterium]|nr:SH3 domain-containing protein [Anaerolineae bacterium]